jgi:hypothetical protein
MGGGRLEAGDGRHLASSSACLENIDVMLQFKIYFISCCVLYNELRVIR